MSHLSLRTDKIALDNQALARLAPSIFAEAPHGKMTTRYHMVPTYQGGVQFARHEVRFRHVATMARLATLRAMHSSLTNKHTFVNDEVFDEIVLTNAHDGSTLFGLEHGMFRVACLNGLIVCLGAGERVQIRHNASIVDNVIEGATRLLNETEQLVIAREEMRALTLDKEDQVQFAEAALQLRYEGQAPLTPEALLAPRRIEDTVPSLWHTFNVVQENMIKGGVRGHTVNTGRRMTTRGISGITQDHAVNRMLWNLAQAARNMKDTVDFAANVVAEA
jgi:hypothetical protein